MRCNSPSPRPAAFPPPSPPPMSLGIVRGFIGTMQPSDFSSACMPIVRLLPSWAGPECWPDTERSPKFRRKDVTTCTWGLQLREAPRRQAITAGGCCFPANGTASAPRNSTRFAAQYPARGRPCERFKLALAGSPCITRGRGGRLGLTPWKTFTSYPLASLLGALRIWSSRTLVTGLGALPFSSRRKPQLIGTISRSPSWLCRTTGATWRGKIALTGSKAMVRLWDTRKNRPMSSRFGVSE